MIHSIVCQCGAIHHTHSVEIVCNQCHKLAKSKRPLEFAVVLYSLDELLQMYGDSIIRDNGAWYHLPGGGIINQSFIKYLGGTHKVGIRMRLDGRQITPAMIKQEIY